MILPNLQFYYFGFFTEPLLYLCVPANDSNLSEKIGHIFAVFSKSIFKVLGIYSLKIHNWHGFFILVKRYYTFLHLNLGEEVNFISIRLKLYSTLEHLTVLMFDVLHPYMSVVYTYYYRGFSKKLFGVALVLCWSLQPKKPMKALNFKFCVHKASS